MLNEYWQEQYEKAIQKSRAGELKRLAREQNMKPVLKPIPFDIANLDISNKQDSYIVEKRGVWDVYKNGKYFDSFDTKGAAWRALF